MATLPEWARGDALPAASGPASPARPLADAFGIHGQRVDKRSDLAAAVALARQQPGTTLIEFKVEQEDSVYPMVAAGAALHDMILRPSPSAIAETGSDPV